MTTSDMLNAHETLSHLYAAAAAVIREDRLAIDLLRQEEHSRRHLLQAAISVTAQATRMVGDDFEPGQLCSLASDISRADLLDGALAHLAGDRLTGYETVERLSRVRRSVTDIAAPLIAELWTAIAVSRDEDPEVFARRLCLVAGIVGTELPGLSGTPSDIR
jgi:hypothetical protein